MQLSRMLEVHQYKSTIHRCKRSSKLLPHTAVVCHPLVARSNPGPSRHDLDGEVHPCRPRGVKLEATFELSTCAVCVGLSLQCSVEGEHLPITSSVFKVKECLTEYLPSPYSICHEISTPVRNLGG
jgi:hypothetical protein